jgi:hypothetical protein
MRTLSLMSSLLLLCAVVKAQSSTALGKTKDSAMAFLNGSVVYDPQSQNYISYKWFLQSGATSKVTIVSPDSVGTKVRGLVPGAYQFGFIINDRRLNKSDTSYMTVTVKKQGT